MRQARFAVLVSTLLLGVPGAAHAACVGVAPNDVVEPGEACDDGPTPNQGCCTDQCQPVVSHPENPVRCNDGNGCTCGDVAYCPDARQGDHCAPNGVCISLRK